MKANIWGEEVSKCIECKFWDVEWRYCKQLEKELLSGFNDETCDLEFKSYEEIYKDCPFLKPINKTFIESLGFEYGEYSKKQVFGVIYELHNYDSIHNLWTIRYIDKETATLFNGTIHNQEHFKFILKILGI